MVTTCPVTLDRPGVCCHGAGCGEPAPYAVLDLDLTEHLRCAEHAATDREAGLVHAIKTWQPREGYGVGLAPAT